jgi:hypothetical protein
MKLFKACIKTGKVIRSVSFGYEEPGWKRYYIGRRTYRNPGSGPLAGFYTYAAALNFCVRQSSYYNLLDVDYHIYRADGDHIPALSQRKLWLPGGRVRVHFPLGTEFYEWIELVELLVAMRGGELTYERGKTGR